MNKIYDWDGWFDSAKPVTLKRGVDFDCQVHSMVAQIRNAASRRKRKVSMSVNEHTIILHGKGKVKRLPRGKRKPTRKRK